MERDRRIEKIDLYEFKARVTHVFFEIQAEYRGYLKEHAPDKFNEERPEEFFSEPGYVIFTCCTPEARKFEKKLKSKLASLIIEQLKLVDPDQRDKVIEAYESVLKLFDMTAEELKIFGRLPYVLPMATFLDRSFWINALIVAAGNDDDQDMSVDKTCEDVADSVSGIK